MLGGGQYSFGVDLALTPHATRAIPLEDEPHAGAARQIAICRGAGTGTRLGDHYEVPIRDFSGAGQCSRPGQCIGGGDACLRGEITGERGSEPFRSVGGDTSKVEQCLDIGFSQWLESEFFGEGDNPFLTSHGCSVEGNHS